MTAPREVLSFLLSSVLLRSEATRNNPLLLDDKTLLQGATGFEPVTDRTAADCSTTELYTLRGVQEYATFPTQKGGAAPGLPGRSPIPVLFWPKRA